ncbi:hypothetical protein [Bremerella sp. P1]|uniref:hypothetical protein n=1 Tax=Bremerella sp. P1 TaxID=3026424 RepID=UPI00236851C3|nr:hypothetical protein [Bremerella sp. P1]WDI44767.1 hypothetical protein PSR63_12555 [Bremerella sp. P1]
MAYQYTSSGGLSSGFGPSPIDKIGYNQYLQERAMANALNQRYGNLNVRTVNGRKQAKVDGQWRDLDSSGNVITQSQGSGSSLPARIDQAYQDAKNANEERYQDILGQYNTLGQDALAESKARQGYLTGMAQDRVNQAMGIVSGMGAGEANRINRAYDELASRQHQNLTSRGLNASTIKPTVQSAVERDRQDSLMQLGDRLRSGYLGAYLPTSGDLLNTAGQTSGGNIDLMTGIQQNKLGFMERRNDVYPDLGLYAQLAQAYGQGAYGRTPYGAYAGYSSSPQYNIPGASYGAPMGVVSTSAYGNGVPGNQVQQPQGNPTFNPQIQAPSIFQGAVPKPRQQFNPAIQGQSIFA